MECKPSYPQDYRYALKNNIGHNKLERFLKKSPPCPPLFVFNHLMLPCALKALIDAKHLDIQKNMTQASLLKHSLYMHAGTDIPVIVPSSDLNASVDGLLVFDLDAEQRGILADFNQREREVQYKAVEVDIVSDTDVRVIRAGAYVWIGEKAYLEPAEGKAWKVDDFLRHPLYRAFAGFK